MFRYCCVSLLIVLASRLDLAAAPATALPVAAPAFLDVVILEYHTEGERHKVVVTTGPTLWRIDEVDDGLSVIYRPATQFYTGLEHRSGTYWEFSWPQVSAAVQNSKRYESRLQQLSNEGLNGDLAPPPAATATGTETAGVGSDDSGYVWRPTTERKRIADLDCVRWIGDTVSGEPVEAWCCAGPVPKLQAVIEHLREINEPMALVPVRTVVPDFIFPVYTALEKGGVTPVQISWGSAQDRSWFILIGAKTRDGTPGVFGVPKTYSRTTLITMDGLLEPKK